MTTGKTVVDMSSISPMATQAFAQRINALFESMGKDITLVGGHGDGQTTQVANQIIVALNIAALSEALVFAAKAGGRSGPGAAGTDGWICVIAHPVCAAQGWAQLGHSALVKALELLGHHEAAAG